MKKFVSILVVLFSVFMFTVPVFAATSDTAPNIDTPNVDEMRDVVVSVVGTIVDMKTKGTKQHRIKVQIGEEFDWIYVEGTEYIKYNVGDDINVQVPTKYAEEFDLGYVEWRYVASPAEDHVVAVKTDGDNVYAIIEKADGETVVVEICEAFEITLGETVTLKTNKKGSTYVATYELWRDTAVVTVKAIGIFSVIALVGGGIFFAVAAAKGDIF